MKSFLLAAIAVTTLSGVAQSTNFNQVEHIQTSLNHLTVIDVGEPVTDLAVADPDAFEIERHEDRVFLMPLRAGVATNLFIWTPGRELSYEIDPAGDLAKMNVVVRVSPKPVTHTAAVEPTALEIKRLTSLVQTQTLLGTEEVNHDDKGAPTSNVYVKLTEVFRSQSEFYVRFTIVNPTNKPFRITSPDVCVATPTQLPISMASLRDHQLSTKTFTLFRAKPGPSVRDVNAESRVKDLAPGDRATGVISIPSPQNDSPQLYQFLFGSTASGAVTAEAVI